MSKSDRDSNKWRLRRNTQIKHDILFEYLKGWLSVFSARPRDGLSILHYVDFKDLQNEIEAVRYRYNSVGVRNFEGPFQEHSDEILGLIPPEQPAFVFIDPFGYKGIELDTVLKFVARRWNEVFVTFMTDTIGRRMNDRNKAAGMDRVFGTPNWRRIAESPTVNQKTAAVELYCSQLQARTQHDNKPTYVFPINVSYQDRASDIYHLIHISHRKD